MNTIISSRIVIVNIFFIFSLLFQRGIHPLTRVKHRKSAAPDYPVYRTLKKEGRKAAAHCLPLQFRPITAEYPAVPSHLPLLPATKMPVLHLYVPFSDKTCKSGTGRCLLRRCRAVFSPEWLSETADSPVLHSQPWPAVL